MAVSHRLTFEVARTTTEGPAGPLVVTPQVNGANLVDVVSRFEDDRDYSPAGAYSGIVANWFGYCELPAYFLGAATGVPISPDHVWLLGCPCGVSACWPLEARVVALHDIVTWTDFAQPHRPRWDYATFGPFRFDRRQYERAVDWLVEQVEVG